MPERGSLNLKKKSTNKHISCSDPVKQCDLLVSFLTRIMYEKLNLVCSQSVYIINVNTGRIEGEG